MTYERDEVVDLLRALVRARSENPPGNERAVQAVVCNYLSTIPGVEVAELEAQTGRPIVIATLDGARPGKTLLFGGHIDTVPAGGGWTVEPFGADIADGRLYGRGAADMKGGVAGFLVALRLLSQRRNHLIGTVVAHVVPDEEPGGQLGTRILLDRGLIVGDAAVIAEPSGLCVFRAQKGNVFARLRFRGRSAHGSLPESGDNAVSMAARLVVDLEERLAPRLASRRNELVGQATLSIGTIHGGVRTNVVPDECTLTIDRRTIPGEQQEEVVAELQSFVDGRAEITFDHIGASFDTPEDHWLVQSAVRAVNEVHGRQMPIGGLVGSSDARFYADGARIPTIIVGPGTMDQAHVPDESIDLELLKMSVDTYVGIALSVLLDE